jgi:hypothetical protein
VINSNFFWFAQECFLGIKIRYTSARSNHPSCVKASDSNLRAEASFLPKTNCSLVKSPILSRQRSRQIFLKNANSAIRPLSNCYQYITASLFRLRSQIILSPVIFLNPIYDTFRSRITILLYLLFPKATITLLSDPLPSI